MDLTKTFPASVKTQLHGIVQLQRTIDKGKALAHGNIGEYHYNCPMDQAIFGFLGVDHEALLAKIKDAKADAEIESYVAPFVEKKSSEELSAWNRDWLAAPAPGSPGVGNFEKIRAELAPARSDITTWADLLDYDEKRFVAEKARA